MSQILADALSRNELETCGLQTLRLISCGLTHKEVGPLAAAVSQSHITRWNLQSNRLGVQGAIVLCDSLLSRESHIERLDLGSNDLRVSLCTEGSVNVV